jgi:hypothetical protein
MKNILIKIILLLSISIFIWLNYISNTYAEDSWKVTVIVTEQIPWAWCEEVKSDWKTKGWLTKKEVEDWETQMYKCEIKKGFWSVIEMMWRIIKYFTFIASLWAVLFIILNGILYSMWGAEPSMKDDAKKRIMWTLIWLVLLLLSWVILNIIAPWIYK